MVSLKRLRESFEEYLLSHPLGDEPRSLYDPANYIMRIGGKRMRPMLLLASYLMYKDQFERAFDAALAIEVFHNYTLVHDDLMDSADIRRGEPSVHVQYGINEAILSGDLMLLHSYELLMAASEHSMLRKVLDIFTRTGRDICEGQRLDMDFESVRIVSVEEYISMNLQKTGALLAACLELGAVLAGAPQDETDRLHEAGLELGKAFQIQDDILDIFGEADRVGKKRGGDILNSKKTFLYAATLDGLTPARRGFFIDAYHHREGNPEVKIQKVIKWFEEAGALDTAKVYLESAYREGIGIIEALQVPSSRKTLLLEIADMLRARNM